LNDPGSAQIGRRTKSAGSVKSSGSRPPYGSASTCSNLGFLNSSSMMLCQITPPPVKLSTLAVTSLLLLPLQTPTVTYGV
jgi:hypothetical protein